MKERIDGTPTSNKATACGVDKLNAPKSRARLNTVSNFKASNSNSNSNQKK